MKFLPILCIVLVLVVAALATSSDADRSNDRVERSPQFAEFGALFERGKDILKGITNKIKGRIAEKMGKLGGQGGMGGAGVGAALPGISSALGGLRNTRQV